MSLSPYGEAYNRGAMPDDSEHLKQIILALLDLLEGTYRNLDSAIQVAMRVHDWKSLYMEALDNELLAQHSIDVIAPLRLAVEATLEGRESEVAVAEALQRLKKRPN